MAKELNIAKRCLEKVIKEKAKGKDTSSLMFQTCKQLELFTYNLSKKEKDTKQKKELKGRAKTFGAFAKVFKNIKCETCGGEGVCWVLSPCPDCDEGKRVNRIGKEALKKYKKKVA